MRLECFHVRHWNQYFQFSLLSNQTSKNECRLLQYQMDMTAYRRLNVDVEYMYQDLKVRYLKINDFFKYTASYTRSFGFLHQHSKVLQLTRIMLTNLVILRREHLKVFVDRYHPSLNSLSLALFCSNRSNIVF